jgi:pyruvate carboxylase
MTITMNKEQLDQLKRSYAEMVIEGMDMDMLIEVAVDGIIEQVKNYEYEDIKEEIVDFYGEDVWSRLSDT